MYAKAMYDATVRFVDRRQEETPRAREIKLLTGEQPDDWIAKMTLVQQMEAIGLFRESVKLEEPAISFLRPRERFAARTYSSQPSEEEMSRIVQKNRHDAAKLEYTKAMLRP
ncbi:MAG: hypothetical protein Q9224_006941, partial [Gallowayella concinna]